MRIKFRTIYEGKWSSNYLTLTLGVIKSAGIV